MTIEEMKRRKAELGYTNERVAELSGVPLGTVQKVFGGTTASPRYETLQKLESVLAYGYDIPSGTLSVRENSFGSGAAERPRKHTLTDYYALPEDRRAELIDGVFYDMTAPSVIHQEFLGSLFYLFRSFIKRNSGSCHVYQSPCDVQLDNDEYTMVQPDLFVVCKREQIIMSHVLGAPDLAVEILSPSTRKKDMALKLYKYMNAGVREYWLADTERRSILVYRFDDPEMPFPRIYGPEDTLPVGIWDGKLEIDLAELWQEVEYLRE